MNMLPPLALIAGPTASGKSALALALGQTRPSIVINADSMQVYRDLRVVTARPSIEEERGIPHRLFGYIDGAEACSAARWASDAKAAVAEAHATGRLPILVGGTGLYIRTLVDGIAPVPPINPDVRCEVRALPVVDAFAALQAEDAGAAMRLSPNDSTRVARALEVARSTGKRLAYWQEQRSGGIGDAVRLMPLVLTPPREWLAARCDTRFEAIFDAGQYEVAKLLERGLDPALPVMRAIGVAEIGAYLTHTRHPELVSGSTVQSVTSPGVAPWMLKQVQHDGSREQAIAAGQLATRQYAKRQATWFNRQAPADWPRHDPSANLDLALTYFN